MDDKKTESQAKKQAFIAGPLFAIAFIGWQVIKGQNLNNEDILIGLLLGIIVGMGSYIWVVKKDKR